MADMVFAPAFEDVDSEREVVLEEIAMVDDKPQDLVHDLAAEAVFGNHPLGRPVIGRAEVIAGVSPRALRELPRRRVRRVEHRALGGGPRLARPARRAVRGPPCDGRTALRASAGRSCAAFRDPATASCAGRPSSTTSCLGGTGIGRDDSRRYAVSVLDAILGGSASSRLFQEIREKRGMAYSVYTYGSQYAETGQVGVYVGTREDNLAECLAVTAAELRDVAAGNLRPGELDRAKENLEGSPAALAREHVEPDDPPREGARHGRRAGLDRGDDPARAGGHRGRRRGGGARALRRRRASPLRASGRARAASARRSRT